MYTSILTSRRRIKGIASVTLALIWAVANSTAPSNATPPRPQDSVLREEFSGSLILREDLELMRSKEMWPVDWSPDGSRIAIGRGTFIDIYQLNPFKRIKTITALEEQLTEREYWRMDSLSWGASNIFAFSHCYDVRCWTELIGMDGKRRDTIEDLGGPDWFPDGTRLLLGAAAGLEIWDFKGSETSWSRFFIGFTHAVVDNQRIIYVSAASGGTAPDSAKPLPGADGLVLFNIYTEEWKQLTTVRSDMYPTVVSDKFVIFRRGGIERNEPAKVMALDLIEGTEHLLLNEPCYHPSASPDGQSIVCWKLSGEEANLTLFTLAGSKHPSKIEAEPNQ